MTVLTVAIQKLSDERAIALLRRFTRAIRSGALSADEFSAQTAAMADALSLPADPIDRPSDGQLARAALEVLAEDPRYKDGLAALMSQLDQGRVFSMGGGLDRADVLSVLDTQLPLSLPRATVSVDVPAERIGLVRSLARQFVAFAGSQSTGPQADAEYRVWFATSRKPLDASDASAGFGSERDSRIHYGSCHVFVPRSHKVGSIGSPWWKRVVTFSDDRLRLMSNDPLKADDFWTTVGEHLASCKIDDRDAVVFIHGFNVDFEEAALRAAQIGFDLQVRGAMAFYSWASHGDVSKYPADEAAIELDEAPIADFLCDLAMGTGARRVHVIAHSMGNRALLRAAHAITQQAQRRSGVSFGQIILAAADVDARKFEELCSAYTLLSERTTLYVSTRDAAVEVSRWLHDFPRVGLMPPVTIASGIDTINAVNTDLTLLGHGYVAQSREVVCDIHALIRNGTPPERRFGLRAMSTESGDLYWLIGA